MLQNILLKANEWNSISALGKHINVVLAAGDIDARITMQNSTTFETKLVSGMAFPVPVGFVSVAFRSEVTQQTKIWLGDLPLSYIPLELKTVGASSLTQSRKSVFFGKITELVPPRIGRGKVTVQANKAFNIGGIGSTLNSTITIQAGDSFSINTQDAIYAHSLDKDDIEVEVSKPAIPMQVNRASADVGQCDDMYFNHVLNEVMAYRGYGLKFYALSADLSTMGASLPCNGGSSFNLMIGTGRVVGDTLVILCLVGGKMTERTIELSDYSYIDKDISGGVSVGNAGHAEIYGSKYLVKYGPNSGDNVVIGSFDNSSAQVVDLSTLNWTNKIAAAAYINKDGNIAVMGRDGVCAVTEDLGVTWTSVPLSIADTYTNEKKTGIDTERGRIYLCSGSDIFYSSDGGYTYNDMIEAPMMNGRHSDIQRFGVSGGYLHILTRDGVLSYDVEAGAWDSLQLRGVVGGDITHRGLAVDNSGKVFLLLQSAGVHVIELAGEVVTVGGLGVSIMSELN
ncbi:hypothetical protein [Colwellia sp. E2M01]|uniref:hypothetical protein n=1 Tax=Colwellia sp. E2M01 TaxID=2841561 RepID=UPI001C0974FF|nr:hypothetical protein [Colwellia sp. E2M01]MBU2871970.1 hypothetical protein [Colwellia sp. E2M01]